MINDTNTGMQTSADNSDRDKLISRQNFLKKIIRIVLLAILAVVSVALSGRITFDKCAGCPGVGRCNGETDCNKY